MQINLNSRPELKRVFAKLSLRTITQTVIVLIFLLAAWQYNQFVQYVHGVGYWVADRPDVVEGFLPIAAIVAFKAFLGTGQVDPVHPAGLMIFITILITAWVFRRALCSWICPIGTLSEYLGRLGKKLLGRNLNVPKWLDYILLGVKYLLFFYIFRMFFTMPAAEAVSFMQIPYYAISDIKMFEFFTNMSIKVFLVIGTLMLLSVFIKSFWCRYLCPYGAMVGVLGLLSPIFLMKDDSKCTKCSLCNQVCPNRVDVEEKKKLVVTTECTGCTECVRVCPSEGTLKFKLFGLVELSPKVYSIGFLVLFFGIISWAKLAGHWESSISVEEYKNIYNMFSGMM